MSGLPNGGMIYDPAAPMDNGGPMSSMSNTAVVGAGSRPIGQASFVPAPAPTQNRVPGAAPTPQQAAAVAAQRPTAAPVPGAQPARAAVPPQQQQSVPQQTRPTQNQVPAQTRPTQNQVMSVPPNVPSRDSVGPIAGDGYDCSQLASPGEIKARVYTLGTMITPCQVKSRSLEFCLDDKRSKILKYKCHGSSERSGDLSRVICMGIELIACRNELPVTIDFGVGGTQGRDYNWTEGTRSLLSMPPHYKESNGSAPRKLYMHAPTVSLSAMRRFSHLKTAQLSAGIQPIEGEDWSMVHTSSPVVELIRHSHEALKPTLHNVRLTESRMPIKNTLIKAIQNFLQEKINECPGNDWRRAAVSLTRSSGNHFSDPEGYGGLDAVDKNYELQQSHAVYVKFILYYLILSNSLACQKLTGKAIDGPILPTSAVAGAVGAPGGANNNGI